MAYNRTPEVFEIFQELEQQTTRPGRKEVLLKYKDIPAFTDILRGTFDESLQFLLPEGKPPYTPNRPESTPSTLLREHRKFGYFVKGGPGRDMQAFKREQMFIQLLESVHPDDALLVLSMIAKKSPVKGLTKKLVQEAIPTPIKS